jgi:hypothetical protein
MLTKKVGLYEFFIVFVKNSLLFLKKSELPLTDSVSGLSYINFARGFSGGKNEVERNARFSPGTRYLNCPATPVPAGWPGLFIKTFKL